MDQEAFHQYYAAEAEKLLREFTDMTEDALLALIANPNESRYGIWEGRDNFQIWYALQARGSARSIAPLYAIVSNLKNPYLIRYHACVALFSLAGITDEGFRGEVQYGLNAERQPVNQREAIERLGKVLGV